MSILHTEFPCTPPIAAPDNDPVSDWSSRVTRERVRVVGRLRHVLVDRADEFIEALRQPHRTTDVESLAGEIIPLADACKFLEKRAESLLRVRRLNSAGRPLWLWGVDAEIHREPLGRVLIIGPANYPLMLPGIMIVQALVAGNLVVFKPAPGTRAIAKLLCDALYGVGVPREALVLLDEEPLAAEPWYARVDKVFMTASESSGRAVLQSLAAHLVPAVMELSGCDAVFVLPGADLKLVVAALRFGLTFNNSATCLAPRRVFIDASLADAVVAELKRSLVDYSSPPVPRAIVIKLDELGTEALATGAKLARGRLPFDAAGGPLIFDHAEPCMSLLQEDVMAPVLSVVRVRSTGEALAAYGRCGYRLGASVFGPEAAAIALAGRIRAGSVVINDLIVPTADPRLPFGGRRRSGFGVSRGVEGLLEMTCVKAISLRRGAMPFHLRPQGEKAGPVLRAYLGAAHGRRFRDRLGSFFKLIRAGKKLSSDPQA